MQSRMCDLYDLIFDWYGDWYVRFRFCTMICIICMIMISTVIGTKFGTMNLYNYMISTVIDIWFIDCYHMIGILYNLYE